VYERALTLGHHPHRLGAELTDPDVTAFAGSGASYKFRIPALSAVIAREQLRGLPARNANAEANWRTLHEIITCSKLPIQFPRIAPGSVRGWYGTPLVVTDTIQDPAALFAKCTARGIPLRALYPDWLASPLLQRPDLLARFWPNITSTAYRPPDPESLTAYQQLRRQMLIVKIPDLPAPDYMEQVGNALAAVLATTTATV
ncbi:MAG: DegT/DnrJ/EryC1/StrS family aminotransferase, partial [Pseudonocardiaceae bacterium]